MPAAVLKVWRRANFTGDALTFAVVCSSVVVALHTLVLPIVAVLFWVRSGLGLLVTAASLYGNEAGDSDAGESRDQLRRRRVGRGGAADARGAPTGSGDGESGGAVCPTSVAQMLKQVGQTPATAGRRGRRKSGGGGESSLSVAEIYAYLEDPATTSGRAKRRDQHEQAATWEQITRMRNHLDEVGRDRSDAVLARLARVEADLKASIEGLVERSVASGVERGLRERLGDAVADLVEEKVTAVVERAKAPPRTSVAAVLPPGGR